MRLPQADLKNTHTTKMKTAKLPRVQTLTKLPRSDVLHFHLSSHLRRIQIPCSGKGYPTQWKHQWIEASSNLNTPKTHTNLLRRRSGEGKLSMICVLTFETIHKARISAKVFPLAFFFAK